jgi:transcriptional/translational regulatory protein YebC/TACO1
MFEKKGQISVPASSIEEDALMEAALDAGAEDVVREDDLFTVSTSPNDFHTVQEALKVKGVQITEAELAMLPKNTVKVEGKEAESLFKLLETIEDLDDVQKVWANFDVDVADLSRVEG